MIIELFYWYTRGIIFLCVYKFLSYVMCRHPWQFYYHHFLKVKKYELCAWYNFTKCLKIYCLQKSTTCYSVTCTLLVFSLWEIFHDSLIFVMSCHTVIWAVWKLMRDITFFNRMYLYSRNISLDASKLDVVKHTWITF